jgi:hypothetical protein
MQDDPDALQRGKLIYRHMRRVLPSKLCWFE